MPPKNASDQSHVSRTQNLGLGIDTNFKIRYRLIGACQPYNVKG